MTENNFTIHFSGEIQKAIELLASKYRLERDLTLDIFELMKIPDPEIVIFDALKMIVGIGGVKSLKEISDSLKKQLRISEKTADNLIIDIKKNIVPLISTPSSKESEVDIILDILKSNNLLENSEESIKKERAGREPRIEIIRDAAITIKEQKIPDAKTAELLADHLGVPHETAKKIVEEIRQKLLSDSEKKPAQEVKNAPQKPSQQPSQKEKIIPFIGKKIEIKSSEKQAITPPPNQEERKVKTVIPQEQEKKGPDDYREIIE